MVERCVYNVSERWTMKTDKFTLFVYCNCLVLLSTSLCSQSINKQIVNLADENFTDYSFLSRYHYTRSKKYLKRRYRIRHWIPMFVGTYYQSLAKLNWVTVPNSNFLIPISLQPDANLWYYKLRLFDLTEFIASKISKFYGIGLQNNMVWVNTEFPSLFTPKIVKNIKKRLRFE